MSTEPISEPFGHFPPPGVQVEEVAAAYWPSFESEAEIEIGVVRDERS